MQSTRVTFPQGAIAGAGTVLLALDHSFVARHALIVVDETPFHPVDHTWPDQPADFGILQVEARTLSVVNALTAAVHNATGELLVDKDIHARRGDPDWAFLVAHVVELPQGFQCSSLIGHRALLQVDFARRLALSAVHTACHLMALALNSATHELWRKEPAEPDSLGNPNLDQAAVQSSEITLAESIDRYRFGKSIRKKGFDAEGLFSSLGEVEARMNRQVNEWIAAPVAVRIVCADAGLEARRWWQCDLPVWVARIPCGGTHVADLHDIASIRISIERTDDEAELVIRTAATAR